MKNVVLLPTYNEKENLAKMVTAILAEIETDILVIDDNSPDGTGKIADELAGKNNFIKVLHREKKQGLGKAYVAGYKWALKNGYAVIIQMDCDFSHDPKYLPEMLKELDTADVILGSRYSAGISCYNWPLQRILLSKFANVYTQFLTRMPVKDATGGFKIFKSKVLQAINVETVKSNGYGFQIETSYRAFRLGYILKEFPIIFYERTNGKSKMSKMIIFEAFFLVLKMFLGNYKFKAIKNA
jgi:dolichol-phosphate mannosyltransferase